MQKKTFNLVVVLASCVFFAAASFAVYKLLYKQSSSLITAGNSSGANVAADIERIEPATKLPNFSFTDKNGKKRNIAEFKGKIILINFWATWCLPCIEELPQLDQLEELFGAENLAVIPISIDQALGVDELKNFYKKHQIKNLAIFQDKEMRAYESINSFGIPTSVLVDRQMRAHLKVSGYLNWLDPEFVNLINTIP